MKISAKNKHYRILNEEIRSVIRSGTKELWVEDLCGQRYIGCGISAKDVVLHLNGTPGNDLGAFMDGPRIFVEGNAQDGVGNTMNDGMIIVKGYAGDVLAHSMRGGKVYVEKDAGYRVGIHMKSYKDQFPVVIIGGRVKDYAGEYMAGGILIVLGLNSEKKSPVGEYLGTGMHGGKMYIRGELKEWQLGKEVGIGKLTKDDIMELKTYLNEYFTYLNSDKKERIKIEEFTKLYPKSSRPYGKIYVY